MNKKRRNEKGFTMVELVIVIAIMGIIGAVLVPAFGTMSTKARISADVATVKTLKRTADIYKAEKGEWPKDTTGTEGSTWIKKLESEGYLESNISLQLSKAKIYNDETNQTVRLDLSDVVDTNVLKALKQIDNATKKDWMVKPTAELPTGVTWPEA